MHEPDPWCTVFKFLYSSTFVCTWANTSLKLFSLSPSAWKKAYHTIHSTWVVETQQWWRSLGREIGVVWSVVRTRCRGQRGKCWRSWRMTDMQQILAGVHNAEARATEAERQAQATQQELPRFQASVEGKGEGAAVPLQQEQGIGAFASKYQPHPFEGEDDKRREWARVFRSWSGRFFRGALTEIYDHVKGHRNDSATILDLALTSLSFDAGLLRNFSTDAYHVLVMLTRGRAQRLVLKAAEQEGLEAYRLLVRRYEPVSRGKWAESTTTHKGRVGKQHHPGTKRAPKRHLLWKRSWPPELGQVGSMWLAFLWLCSQKLI